MPAHAYVASDAWITQRAKMRLLLSPEINASDLHVDTTNGRVTLFGDVPSDAQKHAAERLAGEVLGVRGVRDLLVVLPASARPAMHVADATLAANVASALGDDPILEAADTGIRVESVEAGTVVLGGHASTLTEQYRALRLAREVEGVQRVASVIEGPQLLSDAEVWGEAAQARRDAAEDTRLINAVKVKLLADPNVPALDVSVDAVDGVVTLFGIVPSESTKHATEQAARSVKGVRNVRNELLVQRGADTERSVPPGQSVRNTVAAALSRIAALDAADIVVSMRDEHVQLSGRVPTQADRLTALTTARAAAGSHAVIDALAVGPSATPAAPAQAGPVDTSARR